MRKITALVLLSLLLATLTACSGSFTCAICQKEKTGKRHELKASGIKATVCDDCYSAAKELLDLVR